MSDLIYFDSLRTANVHRQREWDTGGNIDLSYAGNELAGETGEAIAEALRDNVRIDELANELGDVAICCDLVALNAGIALYEPPSTVMVPRERVQRWCGHMSIDLGAACNIIKKLERERHGMPGSRATKDDLRFHLSLLLGDTLAVASAFNIDLIAAVAAKFNATSEKVGLLTRMNPKGGLV